MLSAFKREVTHQVCLTWPIRLLIADHLNILERDADIDGHGDVVLTPRELEYEQIPSEYAINNVVIAIAMMQLMQFHNNNEVFRLNVVDDGNGENTQSDPEHANRRRKWTKFAVRWERSKLNTSEP